MRYLIIFLTIIILYIISRRDPPRQRIHIYRNDTIDLTTTRYRRGIPDENIKFRPEDEVGIIQLFHIYD